MNGTNTPAVELSGVTKRFGRLTAVDNVSLTLAQGEFLTIFGPNGAGKTTLLRMIAGLTRPTEGAVAVAGGPITGDGGEARRAVGLISHQPFSYGQLTALENLMFFASLYGVPDPAAKAHALLESVGLAPRAHDLTRAFSRGMLQRLAIARALVHDPAVMLLDEPFTGLDQHAAEILRRELARLSGERRTIVMITHNLSVGLKMSSRVAFMAAGRVRLDAPARGLDPAHVEELYFSTIGGAHY